MKYNFQKAEEIYIPPQPKTKLEIFILNNFELPDNNLNQIISYINNVKNLENTLFELPKIVNSELPNDKLQLSLFTDEWEENTYLYILIFTSYDGELSAIKENELYKILINQYDSNIVDAILFGMVYEND